MQATVLLGALLALPISAIINCRLACTQCRDPSLSRGNTEVTELYCAMCEECKERRREWLGGQLNLRVDNDNYLNNYAQSLQEDCIPELEEPCQEGTELLSAPSSSTTSTTTSTTTTSTTTHRPCTPKPPCKTKPPCAIPCMPFLPVCPTCAAHISSVPPKLLHASSTTPGVSSSTKSTTDSLYFYVGVPKKLLKELKTLRS